MAKVTRGHRTRSELLKMAAHLFALHGYHQTSTKDILEAVSVSKGAFYHHFAGKEELALAVLAQLRIDLEEQVCNPVRDEAEPSKRFWTLLQKIDELNTMNQANPFGLLSRLGQDNANQENRLSEQVGSITSWLLEFFEDCVRDTYRDQTTAPHFEPPRIAELLLAMIIGTVSLGEFAGRRIQPNRLADWFKTLLAI